MDTNNLEYVAMRTGVDGGNDTVSDEISELSISTPLQRRQKR